MFSRNWEDWALALPLAIVPVVALTFSGAQSPSFATDAIAAEQSKPNYVMTITGKRLPADCKGVADKDLATHCIALMDSATVTMRKAN